MWVKLIDGFMDINIKTTRQNRPLRDTQFAWRRRHTRCKVVRRERQRQLKCCMLCWIWMLRRCFVWIVWPTFVSWLVILGNWVCELTTTTTTVAAKLQVASGIKELWNTQSWNENTTNIIIIYVGLRVVFGFVVEYIEYWVQFKKLLRIRFEEIQFPDLQRVNSRILIENCTQ